MPVTGSSYVITRRVNELRSGNTTQSAATSIDCLPRVHRNIFVSKKPRRSLGAIGRACGIYRRTPPISNQGMYRSDACSVWRTVRRIDRFRGRDYLGKQIRYSPTKQRALANQHKGQRHEITNAGFIERNWSAAALGVFSRRRKAAAAGTRGSARSTRRARGCYTRIGRALRRSFTARPRAGQS